MVIFTRFRVRVAGRGGNTSSVPRTRRTGGLTTAPSTPSAAKGSLAADVPMLCLRSPALPEARLASSQGSGVGEAPGFARRR